MRAAAVLVLAALALGCASEEERAARRRLDGWLASLDAREGVPWVCDGFARKADDFRRAGADGDKVRRFESACAHDAPIAWAARELTAAASAGRAPACEEVALALLDVSDGERARERALVADAVRRCCAPAGAEEPPRRAAMRAPCARLGAP